MSILGGSGNLPLLSTGIFRK